MNTTKKYIEKWIEYYKPILGLNLQTIKVEYEKELDATMEISFTYPYYDPTVKFGDITIELLKKDDLQKERILHELCHILTDPLYYKARSRFVRDIELEDERERLTDKISLIINNILKD